MYSSLSVAVLVLYLTEALAAAAQSLPNIVSFPKDVVIPIGSNGIFTCKSLSSIIWITKKEGSSTSIFEEDQMQSFITYSNKTTDFSSNLILAGDAANNLTKVGCVASLGDSGVFFSEIDTLAATLKVYGPPSQPEAVELSPSQTGSGLLLSWLPSFSSFSIPISYEIEVLEQPHKSIVSVTTTNATSLWYNGAKTTCSPVIFHLYASNEAGRSDAAMSATYYGLTKPNMKPLTDSLKATVSYDRGKVIVSITFQEPEECEGYSVEKYFLHLTSSSNETYIFGPTTEHQLTISTKIQENQKYIYMIEAVNNINESARTSENLFRTTDVQSSTVTVLHTTMTVTCRFAVRSRSQGCYFHLSDRNISFSVERMSGQVIAVKSFQISEDIKDAVGIVYDWEENGTIGSLGIPVRATVETTNAHTMNTAEALSPENGTGSVHIIAIVVGGVVLLAVSMTLLVSCICGLYRKKRNNKVIINDIRYGENAHLPKMEPLSNPPRGNNLEVATDSSGLYHECGSPGCSGQRDGGLQDPSTENPIYETPNFRKTDESTFKEEDVQSSTYSQLRHSSCSRTSNALPESHYSQLSQIPTYAVLEDEQSSRASSSMQHSQVNYYHPLIRPSSMSSININSSSTRKKPRSASRHSMSSIKISAIL